MTTRRTFLKLIPAIGLIPIMAPQEPWKDPYATAVPWEVLPSSDGRVWFMATVQAKKPQMLRWTKASMEPLLVFAQFKTKEEIIKQWRKK